jgi:hypothetical protein
VDCVSPANSPSDSTLPYQSVFKKENPSGENDTIPETPLKVLSPRRSTRNRPPTASDEASRSLNAKAARWEAIRTRIQSGGPPTNLLERLLPKAWVNDDVIDTILDFFPSNETIQVLKVYFLNEPFTPKPHKLSVTAPIERYLVPVYRKNHWIALDVHVKDHIIYLYNSLSPQGSSLSKKHWTYSVCTMMAQTADTALGKVGMPKKDWTFYSHVQPTASNPAPKPLSLQQDNGYDCGVFTLINIFRLLLGINPRSEFSPTECRLTWAEEIIKRNTKPKTGVSNGKDVSSKELILNDPAAAELSKPKFVPATGVYIDLTGNF